MFTLLRHISWRNDLNGFPTECGNWAADCGCTRLELEKQGCVRTGDLETSNTIVFDVGAQDVVLNEKIDDCVRDI